VPLPRVLFDVGQGGAHAALSGAGVRAGRVELGEHRRLAPSSRLDRRPQAGAAGANDDGVVGVAVDLHRRRILASAPGGREIVASYSLAGTPWLMASDSRRGPSASGTTACTVPTRTQPSAGTSPSQCHSCSPPCHRSQALTRARSSGW